VTENGREALILHDQQQKELETRNALILIKSGRLIREECACERKGARQTIASLCNRVMLADFRELARICQDLRWIARPQAATDDARARSA